MQLHRSLLLTPTLFLALFLRYITSMILVNDLDLSRSPKIEYYFELSRGLNFLEVDR